MWRRRTALLVSLAGPCFMAVVALQCGRPWFEPPAAIPAARPADDGVLEGYRRCSTPHLRGEYLDSLGVKGREDGIRVVLEVLARPEELQRGHEPDGARYWIFIVERKCINILRNIGPVAVPYLVAELERHTTEGPCLPESAEGAYHYRLAAVLATFGEDAAPALSTLIDHAVAMAPREDPRHFTRYSYVICCTLGEAGFDAILSFLDDERLPQLQGAAIQGLHETGRTALARGRIEHLARAGSHPTVRALARAALERAGEVPSGAPARP
jgi:hypothetical protein